MHVRNVTYIRRSHVTHIRRSHVTYEGVMSRMKESCHIWVMSNMKESCHIYDGVMPHIYNGVMSHIYEGVMSHMWKSHVILHLTATHMQDLTTGCIPWVLWHGSTHFFFSRTWLDSYLVCFITHFFGDMTHFFWSGVTHDSCETWLIWCVRWVGMGWLQLVESIKL